MTDAFALQSTSDAHLKTGQSALGLKSFWWVVLSFWLVVSLASGLEVVLLQTVGFREALWETISRLLPWLFMTVLIIKISSTYTLDRANWKRSLWAYLAACVVSLGVVAAFSYFGPPPIMLGGRNYADLARLTGDSSSLTFTVLRRVTYQLPTFWGLVAVAHAIRFYERENFRRLREAELRAQLIQAQLQALQLQLNPHFLFNTLNSIASLVHDSPATAEKMIEALGALLRLALATTGCQQVTVREELHFLNQYLLIERIRFGERLRVEIKVNDTVLDEMVPVFILQPIVENAVKHGVEEHLGPSLIRITAQPDGTGGFLSMEVSNNGPASSSPDGKIEERVGLTNTRARLQAMFGPQANLELQPNQKGGFATRILIPLQTAANRPRSPESEPAL
jgi:two-component system, LytTR family, sensor kinase